ncbi:MAG: hypothetical protein IKZ60_06555 [Bacteroidales bacterium]|nr:hypothetical protein [Bacteroidales bacterium]
MKKNYLIPFAECINLNSTNVIMTSPGGSLGDLGETPVITDSISEESLL